MRNNNNDAGCQRRPPGQLASLFLLLVLTGSAATAADLKVHDAWIQEGPPGIGVLAGYLDLQNNGDTALRVTSVQSTAAAEVEIHRTEIHGNMASMVPVPVLTLPPHSRLQFKPGGYHLMLMGLHSPLKAGDAVELSLHLGDGSIETIKAEVRKGGE